MQQVSVGRIVIFHPNGEIGFGLPNSMLLAPLLVTQVFDNVVNGCIFVADSNGHSVRQVWSICHKDMLPDKMGENGASTGEKVIGTVYWDWPELKK